MRTRKLNLKSGFLHLLGYASVSTEVPQPLRLEQLRLAMLGTLGEAGCEEHARLARQLRFAGDVLGLWYSRSELMAALASMHGETRAREEMERLSTLFQGLLPRSMTPEKSRTPG